jgi:uncharacterized protein (DUF2062 family)
VRQALFSIYFRRYRLSTSFTPGVRHRILNECAVIASAKGACLKESNFLRRRIVDPLLQLLRAGATPRRLAWSVAVGIVIGLNPLLGSTTLVALGVASLFRLNLVASQLGNHIVYPLELLFFPVFIHFGIVIFHTPGLPMDHVALFHAVKYHPWDTTRLLWRWEWHALIVWACFAVIAAPILERLLRPALEHMLTRLKNEPIVEK